MSRNKKFIVITGQIASGKSSLAELIKERNENYLVLDADDQIKELYKRGAELYKVLVNEFGDSILNEKGNISKSKLRKIVFLNDENREKLNSLTHPVILNNMVNLAKNSDAEVVFLQIPLLNESIDRLEKLIDIDEIWNVTANDEVRFKRLMERKGITEEIARRIMKIQSEFENESYDILSVENNGDFEELKDKLDLFFKNSCINEGKKVGFFGKLKKSKQEEAEEDKAIIEDKTEDADVVRKLTEDELKAMNTAEEVFNDHPLEKENLDNNENLDGFMKSVFANEQSTENVDLKNLESQNSLNMEKTKLTDLSLLREEKLDSTNSAKNGINNSNEEFFEEEVVEDTKKDKGKKKKKKMKMWKKILITIITVLIICKALFLGAVYYGGKNYPINYIEEIQKYSNEYGVDPKVVLAIMRVESNFKSDAVSKVNAKGLMQVLPDTAKHVAKLLNVNVNSVDLNDPETNVKFGTYYLKYLMQNFSNMDTVYAAYNGGIGNVNTWLKDSKYSNDGVSLYNIPSSETKNYVNKVNKALKAYEILYGKEFPTKKTKGFAKFIDNVKNSVRYIFRNF
ncbi:dephospho-CoA kinase [Parvimonas micra]|uniref:dephospho-CoA kinase n=1 Tax=Parvimonas micra TaxID=33033 RepID=UPI002002ADFB|nr:dephospho-CoA kinase [Parvimonas micra]MCK6129786.1 dephospho-CoA kinase [Parvimonas micra]MCK6135432.1 dephospho-CoA kinase [Parvimonas micra]MCK6136904.1 dephospho-CoA kinase [Parvimonas micra]MCK6153431.1 dephospho-CoA kinase [Parvimonas micra]